MRLNHIGVAGQRIRFFTVTLHLHHESGYVTSTMRERNLGFMLRTMCEWRTRVNTGLDQWLPDDGSAALAPDDRVTWLND